MTDEIIRELWEIKDRIAKEHDYDLEALVAHMKTRKREGNHQVVDLQSVKETAELIG